MRCHEVDYEIIGHEMQLVEVELDPGETVVAEAGAMMYMEQGIQFDTRMGDGSRADEGLMGKLLGAGKRMMMGESMFTTHFTNSGNGKRRVAFAAPYPGTIVPLNLAELGERIFNDTNLSNPVGQSCASCHDQGAASNCVNCHREAMGINPHPPGWRSTVPAAERHTHPTCRICHN